MAPAPSPRTPQPGDLLILQDDRRFVLADTEMGRIGWWYKAVAEAGDCTLQSNAQLEWDDAAAAWRPASAEAAAKARLASLDRRRRTRTTQPD